MNVHLYRNIPVEVTAIEYFQRDWDDVMDFLGGDCQMEGVYFVGWRDKEGYVHSEDAPGREHCLLLQLAEGQTAVCEGDFIVRGRAGIHVVSGATFRSIYERV